MYRELTEIRKIRKRLGLTQKKLAEMAGISQSLLAKIETGRINPTYTKTIRIFKILEKISRTYKMKVEDILNKRIIFTSPEDKIKNVIKLMKSYGISQLPVIENGKLIGLVTEGDILESVRKNGSNILGRCVSEIMGESPPIVSIETDIDVIQILLKYFPIVMVSKKGELIGLVAKSDILNNIAKI